MKELGLIDYNVKVDFENFRKELEFTIAKLEENKSELIHRYRKINRKLNKESKD